MKHSNQTPSVGLTTKGVVDIQQSKVTVGELTPTLKRSLSNFNKYKN